MSEAKEEVRFFRSPAAFRNWLARNHDKARELLVGYYRKESGRPSITWPESVDEALCVGWIDGIRKRMDGERYTIRFTPRKEASTWSAVNIAKVRKLIEEGRMTPAGLRAFETRRENRSGVTSYEKRPQDLDEPYRGMLRKNEAARRHFEAQPPWYRRAATWGVISAKKEETRLRRLAALIEDSAAGRPIQPLKRSPQGG